MRANSTGNDPRLIILSTPTMDILRIGHTRHDLECFMHFFLDRIEGMRVDGQGYGHIIAKTPAIRLELQKWILEEKKKMTDRDAEFKYFADERRWESGAVGWRETRYRDER